MFALLIGLVTVVIGCWLSDNCWSPEPEGMTITVAWPPAKRGPTPVPPLTPISVVSSSPSTSSQSSSAPESDWPLVEISDGDSMNLWHHALCQKNSNSSRKGAVLGNGHVCHMEDTEHADTVEVTDEWTAGRCIFRGFWLLVRILGNDCEGTENGSVHSCMYKVYCT